jgi:hypothetical protein
MPFPAMIGSSRNGENRQSKTPPERRGLSWAIVYLRSFGYGLKDQNGESGK